MKIASACRRAVLLLAMLTCASASGADGIPASASNCDVATPPADAGEFLTQGVEGRVFPRLGAMPKSYTGCQTAWSEDGSGWQIAARVYIVKGAPTMLSTPAVGPYPGMLCHYAKRKLVSGPAADCFPYERLKIGSFPKDCAASFKKTGKAPAGCVEDGGS